MTGGSNVNFEVPNVNFEVLHFSVRGRSFSCKMFSTGTVQSSKK